MLTKEIEQVHLPHMPKIEAKEFGSKSKPHNTVIS